MTSSSETERGATAVVSHRVRDDQQVGYDKWLDEIGPVCKTYPGHLDVQIVRPVPGVTATYTVIVRFDTRAHLQKWMGSPDRQRLVEKVRPLLATDDEFFVRSGLDFWFTPEGAEAKLPTRWKQFLVTWSAIYPLVLGVALAVELGMGQLAIPDNRYVKTLFITCVVVLLMVYVVMPRYTKLVRRWLFR